MTAVSRHRRRNAGSGFRRRWRGRGTRESSWRRPRAVTSGGWSAVALRTLPYSTWPNPLRWRWKLRTAPGARRSTATRSPRDRGWTHSLVMADGDAVYWSEARPLEGGRDALVRWRADGARADVIPAGFSARTRVHEYGGGAYTVHDGDRLLLPRRRPARLRVRDGAPRADHAGAGDRAGLRYADLQVDGRPALLRARARARARARQRAGRDPARRRRAARARVRATTSTPRRASRPTARSSPGWPGTTRGCRGRAQSSTWRTSLDGVRAEAPRGRRRGGGDRAAGSGAPTACCTTARDRTGWWNLYRGDGAGHGAGGRDRRAAVGVRRVLVRVPGRRADRLRRTSAPARDQLAVIEDGALRDVPLELTRIVDLTTDGAARAVRRRLPHPLAAACVRARPRQRRARALSARRRRIDRRGVRVRPAAGRVPDHGRQDRARALLSPASTPTTTAPAGERPPLIVRVHGGPTAHVELDAARRRSSSSPAAGSRVVDVNYGGSDGLRPRVPRPAARHSGASSTSTTAVNAARYLADGRRGRRRADGDHRRQRRRLDGAVRAAPSTRRVRLPAPTTSASPTLDGFVDGHAQVRVALHRLADRPCPRRAVARALADQPRRQASARR